MSYSLQSVTTGLVGAPNNIILMSSTDTYAVLTTAGYLSSMPANPINPGNLIIVAFNVGTASPGVALLSPTFSATGIITLVPTSNSNSSTVTDNIVAHAGGGQTLATPLVSEINRVTVVATSGDSILLPISAAGLIVTVINAATNALRIFGNGTDTIDGASAVVGINQIGSTSVTYICVTAGTWTSEFINFQVGADGVGGSMQIFPPEVSKGVLLMTATNNAGNTITTITNAPFGQASTLTIPDPGAASASYLLSTGTNNILTDFNQIVGINNILIASVGTWTRTRIAEANYVLRHTAADDTSVIGIDITPMIRAAANKGFKLASVDIIYSIGTLALDAHTLTLDKVTYANNTAVAVTSVTLTGTLATATQAQPYVSNIAVATPAFLITADSKYVLELTVNAAATSAYDYYGLNLKFSQTIA